MISTGAAQEEEKKAGSDEGDESYEILELSGGEDDK